MTFFLRNSSSWVFWRLCILYEILNQLFSLHTHTHFVRIFIAIVLHYLQIFSPIPEVVFLFCGWFTSLFPLQKLVSLIISHLFVFAFVCFALGDWSKKILLQFMSENVLPMFFSRRFMISDLIFMSLDHSELIFLYGVRECSKCTDLHVALQLSQHRMWKRLSSLHCISLPPLL